MQYDVHNREIKILRHTYLVEIFHFLIYQHCFGIVGYIYREVILQYV